MRQRIGHGLFREPEHARNGLSISRIRNTAPPIDRAQTRNATTTVAFLDAFRPKLAKMAATQNTSIPTTTGRIFEHCLSMSCQRWRISETLSRLSSHGTDSFARLTIPEALFSPSVSLRKCQL
jgi:hypothetical protein